MGAAAGVDVHLPALQRIGIGEFRRVGDLLVHRQQQVVEEFGAERVMTVEPAGEVGSRPSRAARIGEDLPAHGAGTVIDVRNVARPFEASWRTQLRTRPL